MMKRQQDTVEEMVEALSKGVEEDPAVTIPKASKELQQVLKDKGFRVFAMEAIKGTDKIEQPAKIVDPWVWMNEVWSSWCCVKDDYRSAAADLVAEVKHGQWWLEMRP
ncbi:hypothetical protein BY996DRAFT_6472347 [Phakopsora pachyrhizi]|nr:hypothetical protein BY996DRAFT_6472347 [Phakopsora pachyrhizi]